MAQDMLVITTDRIFTKGLDANNNVIGQYSPGYLKQRVKDNYPPSLNVILQATKQMLSDFSVIPSQNGVGLGFKNSFNADKSYWVEDTYKKDIFKHTPEEEKEATKIFQNNVNKIINE